MSRARKLAILSMPEAPVPEIPPLLIDRVSRAIAIACASVAWRGQPGDVEGLMNLTDEFTDYISGERPEPPTMSIRDMCNKAKKK